MRDYTRDRRNSDIASRVLASAKQNRIPLEDNGYWLNHNPLWFNPAITLPGTMEALLDRLLQGQHIYRCDVWLRDLSILLGNLIVAYGRLDGRRSERPVVISLNDNDWHQPARYEHPTNRILRLAKLLHEEELIDMKKGAYFDGRGRGWKTRLWALPVLLADHPELCQGVVVRAPAELIELRAARDRTLKGEAKKRAQRRSGLNLMDYDETAFTRGWRKKLARANTVNEAADIVYYDEGRRYELHTAMKAIFIGDFDHYGRLHACGYRHAQGLSKTARHAVTIDGQPVVELDYSGLHPRLLYAAEGIEYRGDPYEQVIDRIPGGGAWSKETRIRYRPLLKNTLLALLNSPSQTVAEGSVREWLYKHYDDSQYLRRLGISKAGPFIEAFQKAHVPIAHYFGSDIGMKLMNADARIAMSVVWAFAKQGIPILPVHDSFLIPKPHWPELYKTMDAAFRKHADGIACPIKPSDPALYRDIARMHKCH